MAARVLTPTRSASTGPALVICLLVLVQLVSVTLAAPNGVPALLEERQNATPIEAETENVDTTSATTTLNTGEGSLSTSIPDLTSEPTPTTLDTGVASPSAASPSVASPSVASPSVASPSSEPTTTCPTYDLMKDFGAIGNDPVADTKAFQEASRMFKGAGCGVLNIPKATYVVSGQRPRTANESETVFPIYVFDGVFNVTGMKWLQINGNGATVKLADGLYYGGFDTTGSPVDDEARGSSTGVFVGPIFEVSNSTDVCFTNLVVDGNNEQLNVGGLWGENSWQAQGSGILFEDCAGCSISACTVTSCALDGITIRQRSKGYDPNYDPQPTDNPIRVTDTTCTYNGRQGLSWLGGDGLAVTNSKFIHNGWAKVNGGDNQARKFYPPQGAGVFIGGELPWREGWTRGGLFTDVEIHDNSGPGLEVPGRPWDHGYTTFDRCILHGVTSHSATVYGPGMVFKNSVFYGQIKGFSNGTKADPWMWQDISLSTKFSNCTFTDTADDRETTQAFRENYIGNRYANYLVHASQDSGGAAWDHCLFVANNISSFMADSTTDYASPKFLNDSTFIHGNADAWTGATEIQISSVHVNRCTFGETASVSALDPSEKQFRLFHMNCRIDADTKVVDSTGNAPSKIIKWSPEL